MSDEDLRRIAAAVVYAQTYSRELARLQDMPWRKIDHAGNIRYATEEEMERRAAQYAAAAAAHIPDVL